MSGSAPIMCTSQYDTVERATLSPSLNLQHDGCPPCLSSARLQKVFKEQQRTRIAVGATLKTLFNIKFDIKKALPKYQRDAQREVLLNCSNRPLTPSITQQAMNIFSR